MEGFGCCRDVRCGRGKRLSAWRPTFHGIAERSTSADAGRSGSSVHSCWRWHVRSICRALLLLALAPGIAQAQATNDLQIVIGGFQLTSNGAENAAGVSRVIDLGWMPIGKPV